MPKNYGFARCSLVEEKGQDILLLLMKRIYHKLFYTARNIRKVVRNQALDLLILMRENINVGRCGALFERMGGIGLLPQSARRMANLTQTLFLYIKMVG